MNYNTSGTAGAQIIQLSSHTKHPTHEGQPKHCSVCGKYFIWPLVSATCRDERSERCRDCNIDAIRPRSLLGGRMVLCTEPAPTDFPVLSTIPFGGG